jgi:hypothetical protein
MFRRLTAVLVLALLVQGYLPSPSTECSSMAPISGAVLHAMGVPLPGACGQAMTTAQCPTGPCAALPQTPAPFVDTPNVPLAIEFTGRFHDRTPPPPEPPPPQA